MSFFIKRFKRIPVLSFILLCSFQYAFAEKKVDVVIIGGGLSGLATAHELKKAGLSYQILELTQRVGGRAKTVRYQYEGEELVADAGMEEYWESNPAVDYLYELKLPITHDVAVSSMVLQNKLHTVGDHTPREYMQTLFNPQELKSLDKFKTDVAPMISKLTNAQRKGEPVGKDLLKLKDVSFSAWVAKQSLPKKVSEWIRVSVECEIGTHWDRISALDGLAEFHIFLGEGEESFRVVGGNELFANAIADSVGRKNIALNKRVNRVHTLKGKEGVRVYFTDMQTHEAESVLGAYVVSTVQLFRIPLEIQFEPALSKEKMQAMASQNWGSYFKAHIFVPAKAKHFWEKDGNSILPILSDSDLGVIYDGNLTQENAKTKIISLLIHGDVAERYNFMPLDVVRPMIQKSIDKLWPGIAKEIKSMEFYRIHPRAIAAWPVGRSRFDDLSNAIRKPENNVYFAGDFTESSHSDGSFISAKRVVRDILKDQKKFELAENITKSMFHTGRGVAEKNK